MKNVLNTLFGMTKNISKSSSSVLKSASLSMTISNEEENLRSLQMEMGAKVCEMYAEGRQISPYFDECYSYVQDTQEKIARLRAQLTELRGTRACSGCGKSIDKDSEFCPKCGYRINDIE